MDEPLVSRGVAATLKLLKDRGILRPDANSNEKLIEYKDEHGRALTPKEAFKLLSHKFHGKTPGKLKTEKLLKKIETEKIIHSKSIFTPSEMGIKNAERMRRQQGTAHIVVANSSLLLKGDSSTERVKRKLSDQSSPSHPKRKHIFGMAQ